MLKRNYWTADTFVDDLEALTLIDSRNNYIHIKGDFSACNILCNTMLCNTMSASNVVCNTMSASNIVCNTMVCNTISASNIIGTEVTSDIAYIGQINTLDIECQTLTAFSNITTSNIYTSNLYASKKVSACNIIALLNLGALNTPLSNVCPIPAGAPVMGFSPGGGYIDASWIKVDSDFTKLLGDVFALGQLGYDLFNTIKSLANPTSGAGLANDLKNNIDDALKQMDENPGSNQLSVSWWNLANRPIVTDTSFNVGVKGDLYLNEANTIYSIPSSRYTANYNNNQTFLNTTGKGLLLNVGTKQMYLNELYIGSNTYIGLSNQFKINNFVFTSNVIANNTACNTLSAIQFSTSNNWMGISGSLNVVTQLSTPIVNTQQIISTTNGYIQFGTSNLVTKYQDGVFGVSYLKQYPNKFDFITQMSNLGSSNIAPQTVQMSVGTNGLFVASNITSPAPLILQSISPCNLTGTLTIEDDKMRYYNSSNYIVWSVNSNGMFLNQKFSIYGQPEYLYNDILGTSFSNFGRLECGISNGLNYGYGLSYAPLSNNYNVFNASYRGELSTLNSSTLLMNQIVNSNSTIVAPIKLGTLNIDNTGVMNAGALSIKNNGNIYWGSNPILISGKLQIGAILGFDALQQNSLSDGKLSYNSFGNTSINPFVSSGASLVNL